MTTEAISKHWSDLKQQGVDLGAPKSDEADAGYGGRLQEYERGTIFWHPTMGAHALRGRFLQRYVDAGGPGPNHAGERELGFPTSGHIRTADGYECVTFEWGIIEDVPETPLVKISGILYRAWLDGDGATGMLGHPVCDVTDIPSGRMVWFERGVIWQPHDSTDVLIGELIAPQLGHPQFVDPENPGLFTWIRFRGKVAYLDSFPDLSKQLVADRLKLTAVGVPAATLDLYHAGLTPDGVDRWLQLGITHQSTGTGGRFPFLRNTHGPLGNLAVTAAPDGERSGTGGTPAIGKLERRRLYNLALFVPGQAPITISPHCLYARSDWENFGIAHITDTHVSVRADFFRRALRAAGVEESDVALFNNWNDRFREFIRYANHLHSLGLLDVIVLTGDLVDYAREVHHHSRGPGNFGYFEALVRGTAPSPDADGAASEELRVPLFTSLGNHDYRPLPYSLAFGLNVRTSDFVRDQVSRIPWVGDAVGDVVDFVGDTLAGAGDVLSSVPGIGLLTRYDVLGWLVSDLAGVLWQHKGFNLLQSEAKKIIGVKHGDEYVVPNLRPEAAARSVIPEERLRDGTHSYFRRVNRDRSYIIRLGPHRVVMLDTGWDEGIGTTITEAIVGKKLDGLGNEALKNFIAGSPDSIGVGEEGLAQVREALNDEAGDGVVIVGMHAPPINPANNEQPICFRETVHPFNDHNQVLGFLSRNRETISSPLSSSNGDWPLTGTPFFHTGSLEDMLDYGTAAWKKDGLAEIFAGRNVKRPVNLVLSGHGHYRMEFRFKWNSEKNHLEVYTDYYLSTPDTFYSTRIVEGDYQDDSNTKIYLTKIEAGAPPQGAVTKVTDHRGTIWPDLSYVSVPPYLDPLSTTQDAKTWWIKHSPVVTQTAALGPCDNTRVSLNENKRKPGPNQQGFRIIQIESNVIKKVHYIFAEALRGPYPMAWETFGPSATQPQSPATDPTVFVDSPAPR